MNFTDSSQELIRLNTCIIITVHAYMPYKYTYMYMPGLVCQSLGIIPYTVGNCHLYSSLYNPKRTLFQTNKTETGLLCFLIF